MSKYRVALAAVVAFALFSTVLLGFELIGYNPWLTGNPNEPFGPTPGYSTLALLQGGSYVLAPLGWGVIVGAWLWRGRVKSQWTRLGLTEDLFRLLTKMRGSGTRTSIMASLETPKDRFQLSKDLNLDWTTVDYQVGVLLKYGLVSEETAYGNVRLYKLTPIGEVLLKAMRELEKSESKFRSGAASNTLYGP